jgi:hypothetical protein
MVVIGFGFKYGENEWTNIYGPYKDKEEAEEVLKKAGWDRRAPYGGNLKDDRFQSCLKGGECKIIELTEFR